AAGHPVARLRAHRGRRLLRPHRRSARVRADLMPGPGSIVVASSGLIKVVPGLMIWTLIAFGVTFFVLRRYAFGPIQKLIDERRERIRKSIEEADRAREEARKLVEEHRALIGEARRDAEEILAEARRVGDAQRQRVKGEPGGERQRRTEERKRR